MVAGGGEDNWEKDSILLLFFSLLLCCLDFSEERRMICCFQSFFLVITVFLVLFVCTLGALGSARAKQGKTKKCDKILPTILRHKEWQYTHFLFLPLSIMVNGNTTPLSTARAPYQHSWGRETGEPFRRVAGKLICCSPQPFGC